MALTTVDYKSRQVAKNQSTAIADANLLDLYGRADHILVVPFDYTNTTATDNPDNDTIAANSVISMALLKNCQILPTSFLHWAAFGASRTLNFGIQEYTKGDLTVVSATEDTVIDGLDVSAAGNSTFLAAAGTNGDTGGRDGILIDGESELLMKVLGGTLPTNAYVRGFLHIKLLS